MTENNEKTTRHAETWAWWVTSAPELDDLAPIQLLLADQFTTKDGSKPDYTEVQKRHLAPHWSLRLKTVMMQMGFSRVAEEEYAAPSASAQPAEPVLIQRRMRPTWCEEGTGWTEWEDCTEESAKDCERNPIVHDWQHEVRRLCLTTTTPSASPAALTDEQERRDAKYASRYRWLRSTNGHAFVGFNEKPGFKPCGSMLDDYVDAYMEAPHHTLAASPADQVSAIPAGWKIAPDEGGWSVASPSGDRCYIWDADARNANDTAYINGWNDAHRAIAAKEPK